MKVNILVYLTMLMVLSNAKKCCDKECKSNKTCLYNVAAISMGRAIATFQDHYPGFLTYQAGDEVKVLSKHQIQDIEFWEAEVGSETGYIEAAAVQEYSAICWPIEVNNGVHFFSKIKYSRSNADEQNISSEDNFEYNPNNHTSWYDILWLVFKSETSKLWKGLMCLVWDLDSFVKILEWYIYDDGRGTTIAMLIVFITIFSNLWLRKEIKLKDDQLLKLVEKVADVDVENFSLKTKMNDMNGTAKDVEDKLNCLAKEKDNFEQEKIALKDNERIRDLNVEYLREKVQLLEAQEPVMEKENSKLILENKQCVATIVKLTSDTEVLVAFKDQLEEDRQRWEAEMNLKDKQLAEKISQFEAMETTIAQLKAEVENKKCEVDDKSKNVKNEIKPLQSCVAELIRVESLIDLSTHGLIHMEELASQQDDYKCRLHTATAQADSEKFKGLLELAKQELDTCKTQLAREKAKSEVIEEFYKDTLHTSTHSCSHLKTGNVINLSLFKQCQELKDQVQQLEAGMRNLELSYISKLNQEMKQNIEGLETLQNVEVKLYKSQQELTKCQKRLAVFEAQSYYNFNPGRRTNLPGNF